MATRSTARSGSCCRAPRSSASTRSPSRCGSSPTPSGNLYSLISKPLDTTTVDNVLSVTLSGADGTVAYETTIDGKITTFPPVAAIALSTWHHVAASWDGTERRLDIDGALLGSALGPFEDSTLAVAIGGDLDRNVPAIFFAGVLDDVRFYDRALAVAEITVLANP